MARRNLNPNPHDDPGFVDLGLINTDFDSDGSAESMAPFYPGLFAERGVGRAGPLPDGSIDPLVGYTTLGGTEFAPSQNIEGDLIRLRSEMPFLPITAWPPIVRTITLDGINAVDVSIPSAMVLGRFIGNSDYFVNFQGKAFAPVVGEHADQNSSVYRPDLIQGWIYMAGLGQVSIFSPNPGATVSLVGFNYKGWSRKRP